MAFKLLALFCLVSTIAALPVETEFFELDWNNIKPASIRIEPIGPAAVVEAPKLRISGGSEAVRNSVPYIVALVGDNNIFCAGAIISRNYVLTTATCIDGAKNVQIIAGAHNPRTTHNEPYQRIYAADHNDLFKNKNWASPLWRNDIALIRQNNIHVEDYGTSTIRMLASDAPAAGATASLSGWGSLNGSVSAISTYLQTAKLKIISNEECAKTYGSKIQDEHICTSGDSGVGACLGDSGSPLVDFDSWTASNFLIGLVSFAPTPCGSGQPTVYTRMSYFRSWVKEITSI